MNGYFITGTDTNVGKTYATCALARRAVASGHKVFAQHAVAPCQLHGMPGQNWNASHLSWNGGRNDGFVLMPNEVEAYRLGDNAFEFKGTNGFMITVDIASKDASSAARSGM